MFRKIIERFRKPEIKQDVPRVEVLRTKVETIEPEKTDIHYEMKYLDTETGEVHTFDVLDYEAFDKVLSNSKNQLIFE